MPLGVPETAQEPRKPGTERTPRGPRTPRDSTAKGAKTEELGGDRQEAKRAKAEGAPRQKERQVGSPTAGDIQEELKAAGHSAPSA